MIIKSFIILPFLMAIGCNFAIAVQCNFKYVLDNNQPIEMTSAKPAPKGSRNIAVKKPNRIFECEDPDGYEAITDIGSRVKPMEFDTRFGEDEYESAGNECVSSKKTIQPKALNTIYNTLMNVVNNATFIQLIEIDECRPANEPCNSGREPPVGKKILCRQKHVTITLKAVNEQDGSIYDEQFYYPSHCVCELVQKKRSTSDSEVKKTL